jgi:hypothetical protein
MSQDYFLQMIRQLREGEQVILYDNVLSWDSSEEAKIIDFLYLELKNESFHYPLKVPEFNSQAAFWAAKTIYLAAQLIQYRDHSEKDVNNFFTDFDGELSPSVILSADLCLRFLPDMLLQLKAIDSQDRLIEILEKIANKWHYSMIRYPLELEGLSFEVVFSDQCLKQLYINRIIENKKLKLAELPACYEAVSAALGIYRAELWKEFTLVKDYE